MTGRCCRVQRIRARCNIWPTDCRQCAAELHNDSHRPDSSRWCIRVGRCRSGMPSSLPSSRHLMSMSTVRPPRRSWWLGLRVSRTCHGPRSRTRNRSDRGTPLKGVCCNRPPSGNRRPHSARRTHSRRQDRSGSCGSVGSGSCRPPSHRRWPAACRSGTAANSCIGRARTGRSCTGCPSCRAPPDAFGGKRLRCPEWCEYAPQAEPTEETGEAAAGVCRGEGEGQGIEAIGIHGKLRSEDAPTDSARCL
jgi:hypothetical protein